MAKRRRSGPVMHVLSIAAASLAVVALVGLMPPAAEPGLVAAASVEPDIGGVPLRPSYIVRAAPPIPVAPAEPAPVRASLRVEPLAVVEPPAPQAQKWYVTAAALNLRAGPSGSADQLAALPMGTEVEISGTEGKWSRVSTGDGLQGWVFTRYLSSTAPQ